MSSRKGGGKPFTGHATDSLGKGKGVSEVSGHGVEQLNQGVADMNLESGPDCGWEVCGRKSKSRAPKPWVPQNPPPKAWGHPNVVEKLGMGTNSGSGRGPANMRPSPTPDYRRPAGNSRYQSHVSPAVVPPPPQHCWKLPPKSGNVDPSPKVDANVGEVDEDDNNTDEFDESDDELLSDDFDSDSSQKSHETSKKSRWFVAFFEKFDALTVEQISEPARQWHCPACQGGPGAIDWYCGLQPLMTHAKTKGSKRVKLHRTFADLLSEELRRRGTSLVPAGEAFGKWKGLNNVKDREIVWPPMVVIMNTLLEQDENDKWIGMGNQELLDYFSSYSAVRARHSYGPKGHRGMSLLIFEASAVGYSEAERLSKHFEDQGTDREAWDRRRVIFYPGGQRQLYGFMAEKGDLDIFNQHSQGKSKMKFEMRSYQEMVVSQLKQMSEDNQQLILYKDKVAREKMYSKDLEQSYGWATERLRRVSEENRIVRQRTKIHHEQNKEEMDAQEQFFQNQIQSLQDSRDAMENDFERIQQEEREKVKQSYANSSSNEDLRSREEKVAKYIDLQDKRMDEFVGKRDKLMENHREKKAALKQKYLQDEIELEKELENELNQLMETYKTHQQ
ncbi:hypothetical protein LguiB_016974 [Lonicera macranthoides]